MSTLPHRHDEDGVLRCGERREGLEVGLLHLLGAVKTEGRGGCGGDVPCLGLEVGFDGCRDALVVWTDDLQTGAQQVYTRATWQTNLDSILPVHLRRKASMHNKEL